MAQPAQALTLQIAGIKLKLQATNNDFGLSVHPAFEGFLTENNPNPDFIVDVHQGLYAETKNLKPVFTAENLAGFAHAGSVVWQVYKMAESYMIEAFREEIRYQLVFGFHTTQWALYANTASDVQPFGYPLDGLITYLMVTIKGGFLIHASGVSYQGCGMLFAGFSGRGKSTIARLFHEQGATVINDDRLAIRKICGKWQLYNTPMFYPDKPRRTQLSHVFLINHGKANRIRQLAGSKPFTAIMAFCIQHHYHKFLINNLLNQLVALTDSIPTARLDFVPEASVVRDITKFIHNHG